MTLWVVFKSHAQGQFRNKVVNISYLTQLNIPLQLSSRTISNKITTYVYFHVFFCLFRISIIVCNSARRRQSRAEPDYWYLCYCLIITILIFTIQYTRPLSLSIILYHLFGLRIFPFMRKYLKMDLGIIYYIWLVLMRVFIWLAPITTTTTLPQTSPSESWKQKYLLFESGETSQDQPAVFLVENSLSVHNI